MFYNSIILALTAVQVLAQDQYTPDDLNDYGTTIEGTTADPSPTAAPYVPIQSDGTPSNEGASNYTYNGADPSLIADTSIPVNNASAASSVVTSLYTSDASQAGSSASQSSSASSASANSGQTTTPPSTPEAWQHIIYKADTSKCLAVFDTSGNVNTPVVVVDCFYSGHEAHWSVDVTGANTIISRAFNDTRWCLDSGESEENGQPVYLNKCEDIVFDQLWQYIDYQDYHWVVYDRVRSLDLEHGKTEGGGRLQTWVYSHGNTNQEWLIQPAFNANT